MGNCSVSTSSIYTRFKDKAGLFDAVVAPVIDELFSWFKCKQEDFHQLNPEVQVKEMFSYSEKSSHYFTDFIYDNLKIFQILTLKSEGTKHATFIHNLVEADVEYTIKFINVRRKSNLISSGQLSLELLHMLSSAFYSGIFETLIHNMSREDAHIYYM